MVTELARGTHFLAPEQKAWDDFNIVDDGPAPSGRRRVDRLR